MQHVSGCIRRFGFNKIELTIFLVIIYCGQMEERMTLCNMVIEAGGKNGVVPADSTTYKYLEVSAIYCYKQFN